MRRERKRGRKPVPGNETPEARFKRLAVKRLEKTLEGMRLLENLSRRSIYGYSDQQVRWVLRSLTEGMEGVEAAFRRGTPEKPILELDGEERQHARGTDSGRFRDTRTPRQKQLDRNKQAGRFWPRGMGPGPR